MGKYIDKEKVIAELKRRIKSIPKDETDERLKSVYGNECFVLEGLLSFLDTLETKDIEPTKVPKYSYFETIYHCGTEPMWKIGDVLAVYEFYSDREGEDVYGEVIDVKMDEYDSDWVYTVKGDFGGYEEICENELIREEAYKKNK